MTISSAVKTGLSTTSVLQFGSSLGLTSLALILGTAERSHAFSFIFTESSIGNPNTVTHQIGYNGTGGQINIRIGINQNSANASDIEVSTQNAINTWNNLEPTTGNLLNTLQRNQLDFESVLLHELGHSLGLGHPNLGAQPGVNGADQDYTASTGGANNKLDLNAGPDDIEGSADDIRGDDVNLNYFRIADNDPFNTNLGVVDSTTYSRDLDDLPAGDQFSANSDREVGEALGYANTESVLQQGTPRGEAQRTLGADDVAGILYSLTGLDELAGTEDDYTYNLIYAGLTTADDADILIGFDNTQTQFAVSQSRGIRLNSNHVAITSSNIFFNDGFSWFFNDVSNALSGEPPVPAPVPVLAPVPVTTPPALAPVNAPPTPVPTPALLPGLIGMGFSALQKRRRELEA